MSKPSALASFAAKQLDNELPNPVNRAEAQGKTLAKFQVSSLESLGGKSAVDSNSSENVKPSPPSKESPNPVPRTPKALSKLPTGDCQSSFSAALSSLAPTKQEAENVSSDPVHQVPKASPPPRTEKARSGSSLRGLKLIARDDTCTKEVTSEKKSPMPKKVLAEINEASQNRAEQPTAEVTERPDPTSPRVLAKDEVTQELANNSDSAVNNVDSDSDQEEFNFDDIDTTEKEDMQPSTHPPEEKGRSVSQLTEAKFPSIDVEDLYDCPSDLSGEDGHATRKDDQAEPVMFLPRASDIELFHVFLAEDTDRLGQILHEASPDMILGVVDSTGRSLYHYAALSKDKLAQEIVFKHVNSFRETQLEVEIDKLMRKKEHLNAWLEGSRNNGKEWMPPRVKELQRDITKQKSADWAKICSCMDQHNRSIFHYFATTSSTVPMENDYEFCSTLRTRPDILSAKDDFKKLALHYAVKTGNIKQVKWYFQMGTRLSQADVDLLLSFNISRAMENIILRQLDAIDIQNLYHSHPIRGENAEGWQFNPGTSTFVLAKMHKTADRSAGRLHQTPLHRAAMFGNVRAVELLLEQDANANARDANQWTPLHYCAEEVTANHLYIAKLLVDSTNSVDVNARSLKGRSPLHIAARGRQHRGFLSEGAVQSVEACKSENRVAFIEYLHRCKADVNLKDANGATPLLLACRDDNATIAKILLQSGCDPTTTEKNGWNALHIAASRGNPNLIPFLLSWDADSKLWCHSQDLQGRKPVDVARNDKMLVSLWTECYSGNVDQVKRLLRAHPKGGSQVYGSVSVKTKTVQAERTLLHMAVLGYTNALEVAESSRVCHSSREERLKQAKVVELKRTAPNRFLQIVVLLTQAGADECAADKWGITPLMLAGCIKDTAFLNAFLDRISDEDDLFVADSDGNTALHYSYAFCQAKVSTILEDHMDDEEIENNQGKSPFEMTGYRDKIFPKEYREFIKQREDYYKRQANHQRLKKIICHH